MPILLHVNSCHNLLSRNYMRLLNMMVLFRIFSLKRLLLIIFMLVTIGFVNGKSNNSIVSFSGFYVPNLKYSSTDFSAAWFVSKERFIKSFKRRLSSISNMAGVSFAITRDKCEKCQTVVTRDFFDFSVEHLSSSSNQIPNNDKNIFEEEIIRLKTLSNLYKNSIPPNSDARQKETLAVLVYSSVVFSARADIPLQQSIREPFFEVTFWSIHRYFNNVLVYVGTEDDFATVSQMGIPYSKIQLIKTPMNDKNQTVLLPRYSMEHLVENILDSNDSFFQSFKYVYYSEGDQIAHIRWCNEIYEMIDKHDGMVAVVPHRMQALPLAQDFSKHIRSAYPLNHALNQPNAIISIEENIHQLEGSCCENGRYDIAPCKGWWYQCTDWGLRDMQPWIKISNVGLTFPPASEHKEACSYSSHRKQCPISIACNSYNDFCGPIERVLILGPDSYKNQKEGFPANPSEGKRGKQTKNYSRQVSQNNYSEISVARIEEMKLQKMKNAISKLRKKMREMQSKLS